MNTQVLKKTAFWVLFLLLPIITYQCKPQSSETETTENELKISLAQWSIHRSIESGALLAEDFASIAKNDFEISAVEYVATFYKDHVMDEIFWKRMRASADNLGVESLLIMVDDEGDLGNPDPLERRKAVKSHVKWVKAAEILGCHSIRVNAFGEGSKEEVQIAMVDALKQLCTYAQNRSINVLIENHGLYSSDGLWVAEIIRQVNMPNIGTLPDFGNWCTSHKWGSTQEGHECNEVYDRYKGVAELLPFAKGVSAKSYTFDEQGEDTVIDYNRMLKMVKGSKFTGYVGIEFEGSGISESEGILATKTLLQKTWLELNKP